MQNNSLYDLMYSEMFHQAMKNGLPFIKVALLRENKQGVTRLYQIISLLTKEQQKLILSHLNSITNDYSQNWNYQIPNKKYVLINRKIFAIILKNQNGYRFLKVILLAIPLCKIPIKKYLT